MAKRKKKKSASAKIWAGVIAVIAVVIGIAVPVSKIIRLHLITNRMEERERQANSPKKHKPLDPSVQWNRISDSIGSFSAWLPPDHRNNGLPIYQDSRPSMQSWNSHAGDLSFLIILHQWDERDRSLGEPDYVAQLKPGDEPALLGGRKARRNFTSKVDGGMHPTRTTSATVHIGLGNGRTLTVSVTSLEVEFTFDDPDVVKFLSGFSFPAASAKK